MNIQRLLEINAFQLYMTALLNTTPIAQRLLKRMQSPQVGDLVMERSTIANPNRVDRMGILLEHTVTQDASQLEKWRMQVPDGREVIWDNADFIAVPVIGDWADDFHVDEEGNLKPETGTGHEQALDVALRYGNIEGDHHRKWVIDQMVRNLTGTKYDEIIRDAGYDDGEWDTGIAP